MCVYVFVYLDIDLFNPSIDRVSIISQLNTTENPWFFEVLTGMWGASICYKRLNHRHDLWDIGVFLVDVFGKCRRICRYLSDKAKKPFEVT